MRRGAVDVGCMWGHERKKEQQFLPHKRGGEEMGCEHDAACSQYSPNSRKSGKKTTQKASFKKMSQSVLNEETRFHSIDDSKF